MIYVCIPSCDEAPTVGLLLWKIRQVFAAFPREYQLLVLDDGSTDSTAAVLEPYARVLPLTIIRRRSCRTSCAGSRAAPTWWLPRGSWRASRLAVIGCSGGTRPRSSAAWCRC